MCRIFIICFNVDKLDTLNASYARATVQEPCYILQFGLRYAFQTQRSQNTAFCKIIFK